MTELAGGHLTARTARIAAVVAKHGLRDRLEGGRSRAARLRAALEELGPTFAKLGQILSTRPDLVPPEVVAELASLQDSVPPLTEAEVVQVMEQELGVPWEDVFEHIEPEPLAAGTIGQVHRARLDGGQRVVIKVQRPGAAEEIERDLGLLGLFAEKAEGREALAGLVDIQAVVEHLSSSLRRELDFREEAANIERMREILLPYSRLSVPWVHKRLSTGRLLALDWLDGTKLLSHKNAALAERNRIGQAMFTAWWFPFSRFGVIHGDPHLGNYTVFDQDGAPGGINLLDYGCIRVFPPKFVGGVVDLYNGLLRDDADLVVHAYETWGFTGLSRETIDILNIWAKFIYGPLLDDRERTIADGVKPSEYGRREAFRVHHGLKKQGRVRVPREFVFMDRAAIGLGGVFLHLDARLNFYRLFNEAIERFSIDQVAARQRTALDAAGLISEPG